MKKHVFLLVIHLSVFFYVLAEEKEVFTFTQPNREHAQPTTKIQQSRAVAVLSVDAGASQAIADQLMVRLQENPDLTFVERGQLAQITNEQMLALSGTETGMRISAGTLVGADILVLVGRESTVSGDMIRVLVCDSATGARIGQGRMSINQHGIDPLVGIVQETLARFPSRVEAVVTVMDFISRDLEVEYAHLQKDLAELLREALSVHKGVAVVEIDEARSIANEMALRGSDVRRIVPLRLVGEFRTDRLADGGPRISITVTMGRGGNDDVVLQSGSLPVDRAGVFLIDTVQYLVIKTLGQSVGDGISPDEQFNQFVQRAEQFAGIGDFERTGALREAAVLLRPNATAQRIQLVRDYVRWKRDPVEVWPKGAKNTPMDPFWRDIVARARETWRRSLFHVEYLVRNQQVTPKEGAELFSTAISSIYGISRPVSPGDLEMEEQLKKDFIRNMAPLLFLLEGNPKTENQDRKKIVSVLIQSAFSRIDGNFLAPDDFLLIGDLLCDLLPEDAPTPRVMSHLLKYDRNRYQIEDADVFSQQWIEFAKRLTKSDRPLVQALGRYALICHRHSREEEGLNEELLEDARQLVAFLDTDAVKIRDTRGELRKAAAEEVFWIQNKLDRSKQSTTAPPVVENIALVATAADPKAAPQEQSDGSILCERVRLKPLAITVVQQDGAHAPLQRHLWRSRGGGWNGWEGFLPAWKGTDIIYSHGALLFVDGNGMAREVLTDENLSIQSVVFDGKHVWAASGGRGGIYVIDEAGEIVTHVRYENGLPPANVAMRIHVMEEGKILAAGSIGSQRRGWLATVALEHREPRVNVFHEAVKAWNFRDETPEMALDPAMRFDPEWILEHQDRAGGRWFFVGRGLRSPLVIQAKTLQVSVYPSKENASGFLQTPLPAAAFLSLGEKFYAAGDRGGVRVFEMNPESMRIEVSEMQNYRVWPISGPAARLVLDDETLFYAGRQRWILHNLRTGTDEILITNPRSLPDYGRGGYWSLCKSQNFGLIAWYQKKLYQVTLETEKLP